MCSRPVPLILCLVLAACSAAPKIRTESSPTANFAVYRTYAWVAVDEPPPIGDRLAGASDWRIHNAVEADLATRGWSMRPAAADVLIDYGVMLEDKNTASFSDYARYVQEGGKQGMGGAFVDGYQQGTLVLQIYDARTRQLVWRASATAVVGPDDNDALARIAIQKMLADLPSP